MTWKGCHPFIKLLEGFYEKGVRLSKRPCKSTNNASNVLIIFPNGTLSSGLRLHKRSGILFMTDYLSTVAVAHDRGRGLGMKMGGAAFGLTAVDLFDALVRLTLVGDQGQVNRHALGPLAQSFGDLSRKQPIQSLF